MLKGKIKIFIQDKKIGFIIQEDQTDLFFVKKQLQEKDYIPQKNDIVAYEIQPSPTKQDSFEAKNIIFLKEETEKMKETAKDEELEKEQNIQKERQKDLEKIEVLHGKIEWFNAQKGFGVIQSDKLGSVFFHISNLGDCSWIEKNTPVKFRVTEKKNAPIDRKYTVISLELDALDLFIYANTSYHRKNIFDKLNQEQQKKLLEYCQRNCDDEKLYLLWKEDYNLIPSINFLSQKFVNNSIKRKTIFDKLNQEQQQELLEYCQRNCDDETLYDLWEEGYNLIPSVNFLSQKFITDSPQRNNIFDKLNQEQQKSLLDYCQKNCDDEKLYELWKEGYDLIPSVDFIAEKFMNNSVERENVFKKLTTQQQKQLLDYYQKNCDDKKLYELWKDGYNLVVDFDVITQKFITSGSYDRKDIFEKLSPEQQQELLDYCQKNCGDYALYSLWKEEYNLIIDFDVIIQKFIIGGSYERETIFEKTTHKQQQELLDYCEKNCDDQKLYEFSKEGYNLTPSINFLSQRFITNIKERKGIFKKLNSGQKQELLNYCQENCDAIDLYEISESNYNVVLSSQNIVKLFFDDKIIESRVNEIYSSQYPVIYSTKYRFSYKVYIKMQGEISSRKQALEKKLSTYFNSEIKKELLEYCQKNCDDEKLYQLWKKGFNVTPSINFLSQRFINNSVERINIFEKLSPEQQQELSEHYQKNCNDEELYLLWKEGFNVIVPIDIITQKFINTIYSSERKTIFEKLNTEQQQEVLDYCQKNCTLLQKLDLWIEDFFTETPDGVLDGLMTQEESELWEYIEEYITDDKKISLKQAFANEEDYDILLWTYGIIKDFDFDVYAHNYFLLNKDNKRKFNKKTKLELRQELNTKLLNSLEGCEFIKEEDGLQMYEASWRSVWYQNKSIRICIDASEARFTRSFFWDYAHITFNYLATYISGRRVAPLQVYLNGNQIVKIEGLPLLEEVLYKAYITRETQERDTNKSRAPRMESEPKFPQNIILKNVCLQYLNLLQIPDLIPVQVHEYTLFDIEKSKRLDISTLYSIKLPNEEVAVIWESIEFEKSKATHIFKFYEDDYQIFFDNIRNHIKEVNFLRSRLRNKENQEDIKIQVDLAYLGNIDHSNFDFEVWRKSLHKLLPTLPTIDYQV